MKLNPRGWISLVIQLLSGAILGAFQNTPSKELRRYKRLLRRLKKDLRRKKDNLTEEEYEVFRKEILELVEELSEK